MRLQPPDRPDPRIILRRTASLLGHDLRNPMYALSLSRRLLLAGPGPSADEAASLSARALGRVETATTHVRLLALWSLDQLGTQCQTSRLQGAIAASCKRVRGRLVGLELDVEVPEDATASFDTTLLGVVLDTLISNAVQHGTGAAKVRVETTEDTIAVLVQNAGELERSATALVDPLNPAGPADRQAGLGLGLCLSAILTDAMGASLTLQEERGAVCARVLLQA